MGICTSKENGKQNYYNELKNNSFSDLKLFTFDKITTKCRIVDVYDGDTVTIVFYYNEYPIKTKFRMFGYDSPEIKPKKITPNYEMHKSAGKIAKERLSEKILNKVLWVCFEEEEKYGRAMGTLFEISDENKFAGNEKSINVWMVDNGFGKKYDGGKKEEFNISELKNIIDK
jgi:endonuclease YncB( thermonuclease family)